MISSKIWAAGCTLVSGREMQVSVQGKRVYAYTGQPEWDSSRRSVIFIHGAANDHSVWSLQSRYFAYHGRNVLAVDLPGHGRSEGAALTSIEDMASWSIGLCDAMGVERAAWVGHSMGSLIALECAGAFPERVDKIVLIGTVFPMPVSKALLETSAANDHAALDMINIWGHSPAAQLGANTIPGAWMMGSYVRLLERSPPGVLHVDFQACRGYANGLERADNVSCPALFILGQRDLMTPPKAARDLAARIKGANTLMLEGAGHALMGEQPDRVLDALIGFL